MLAFVFIDSFISGPWQTNCYFIGDSKTLECVVIDPGVDAFNLVQTTLNENEWLIKAVLATHGHVDHIASAAQLANTYQVPMWMHSGDDFMLTDPVAGLGVGSEELMLQVLGSTALPKPILREFFDGRDTISVAGLEIGVTHAPGHTPGSCLLSFCDESGPSVFVGDVVFAGSIGRTDLPQGDTRLMNHTLATTIVTCDDSARLLPGHGPMTTMARERMTNPFLQTSYLR